MKKNNSKTMPEIDINPHYDSGIKFEHRVSLDLLDAAKARTYIKGKTIPVEKIGKKKSRKGCRAMTVGDFLASLGHDFLAPVEPDPENLAWMAEQAVIDREKRRIHQAEIDAGKFRKPEGTKQKPGRKPGKKYPKWDAAMKVLAEERRALTAAGKSWRKSRNSTAKTKAAAK